MKVRLFCISLFALLSFFVGTRTTAAQSQPNWSASYYNNTLLSGQPTLTRSEANLAHNWGAGSPDRRINADRFSARWTRNVNLAAGTYRWQVSADDGIRVYVNGQLVLNEWQFQSADFTFDHAISGGNTNIVVEYFENTGHARANVSYQRIGGDSGGDSEGAGGGGGFAERWRGEYYNNRFLSGAPQLIRASNVLDFVWRTGSPDATINADNFSARWTRTIHVEGGRYRFTTRADDGVRIFVNGRLILDKWFDQNATTTHQADIDLPRGQVYLEVQYYEHGGTAELHVDMLRLTQSPPPQQSIIVDNTSGNFAIFGPANRWFTSPVGYNGGSLWTSAQSNNASEQNHAFWTPSLAAGRYRVEVYIPIAHATTVNAQYFIQHRWGRTMVPVNQATNNGRWVSLGTYDFAGNGNDNIALSNVTYETFPGQIAFDAMRWVVVP